MGNRSVAVVYVGCVRIERIYNYGHFSGAASERALANPTMIVISLTLHLDLVELRFVPIQAHRTRRIKANIKVEFGV